MDIDKYFFDLCKETSTDRKFDGILCVDRDGVIIEEKNYLKDPQKIVFIQGSIQALKNILKNNFFVAIVSNQAGLSKGLITETEFKNVNEKFISFLQTSQTLVNCIMYCPYHPDGIIPKFSKDSIYRKPAPGMYEYIKKYYNIKNRNVFMIGDKLADIEFGKNIGAQCIIVDTGYGSNEKKTVLEQYSDVISHINLAEAIKWILTIKKTS